MRSGCLLLVVAMSCGPTESVVGETDEVADTGDALASNVPIIPLGDGMTAVAIFDSQTKYFAYSFEGHAGDHVDLYAQDQRHGQLDTVLSLYKVSATTGRPTGRAIAANDDTANTAWAPYPTASSIDDFDLYSTRKYCIVVSTYQHVAGAAQVKWMKRVQVPAGGLVFPGAGARQPLAFAGVTANALPVSDGIVAMRSGTAWDLIAARVQVDPATLAAVRADDARWRALVFDMLYNAIPNEPGVTAWHDSGTAAAGTKTGGSTWFEQQWDLAHQGADGQLVENRVRLLLPAMFADGAFATSSVQVFFTHYDNGDDTNADGVLAVDAASGELRTVALVNRP